MLEKKTMSNMLDSWMMPPKGYSRTASPENVTGEVGKGAMADPGKPSQPEVAAFGQIPDLEQPNPGRELGPKHKVRAWIPLDPGVETPLLDSDGPGIVRHIWLTMPEEYGRNIILRMYWDHESTPSVEVPLGDFFCAAPGYYGEMQSLVVCVNPKRGFNCYFPMPFRRHARITVENRFKNRIIHFFYTVNFTLEDVPENAAYFHGSFRRAHSLPYDTDMVIADGIRGEGSFAGCYLAWQQNNSGWWGEGEVKMFMDGDTEYPTICGTGTEDYFGGAWCFDDRTFSSPYSGYIVGGAPKVGTRHALYRFHLADPVWFHQSLKVTVQALGWRSEGRFLPLRDDISATAWWYQQEPHAPLPELPSPDDLEII